MSAIPHTCPCDRVVDVGVQDCAGRYAAEFWLHIDGRRQPTNACACGEGLYELLAAGQLRPVSEPTASPNGVPHV